MAIVGSQSQEGKKAQKIVFLCNSNSAFLVILIGWPITSRFCLRVVFIFLLSGFWLVHAFQSFYCSIWFVDFWLASRVPRAYLKKFEILRFVCLHFFVKSSVVIGWNNIILQSNISKQSNYLDTYLQHKIIIKAKNRKNNFEVSDWSEMRDSDWSKLKFKIGLIVKCEIFN